MKIKLCTLICNIFLVSLLIASSAVAAPSSPTIQSITAFSKCETCDKCLTKALESACMNKGDCYPFDIDKQATKCGLKKGDTFTVNSGCEESDGTQTNISNDEFLVGDRVKFGFYCER